MGSCRPVSVGWCMGVYTCWLWLTEEKWGQRWEGGGATQWARTVAPEDATPSVSCSAETVRKHVPMITVVRWGGRSCVGGRVVCGGRDPAAEKTWIIRLSRMCQSLNDVQCLTAATDRGMQWNTHREDPFSVRVAVADRRGLGGWLRRCLKDDRVNGTLPWRGAVWCLCVCARSRCW